MRSCEMILSFSYFVLVKILLRREKLEKTWLTEHLKATKNIFEPEFLFGRKSLKIRNNLFRKE